jgi:hypothetical protein
MRIKDFRPAVESDFPKIKEKELFDVVAPVQDSVKSLVALCQKKIGPDNCNEAELQLDIAPNVLQEISVKGISGTIRGFWPEVVDYVKGKWSWRGQVLAADRISFRLDVTPDSGSAPSEITVRILVKGS